MSLQHNCAHIEKPTGDKTSGTRRGTISCNNPGQHSLASIKTLWLHFHHPYIWQHLDAPTTIACYNIQQAVLTLSTQATTLQSEDQGTCIMASMSTFKSTQIVQLPIKS